MAPASSVVEMFCSSLPTLPHFLHQMPCDAPSDGTAATVRLWASSDGFHGTGKSALLMTCRLGVKCLQHFTNLPFLVFTVKSVSILLSFTIVLLKKEKYWYFLMIDVVFKLEQVLNDSECEYLIYNLKYEYMLLNVKIHYYFSPQHVWHSTCVELQLCAM